MQALISADESFAQQSWPAELLELRDKFTEGSKREIEILKEQHCIELAKTKEEHSRILSRTIERHEKELAKIKTDIESGVGNARTEEDANSSQENLLIRERCENHLNVSFFSKFLFFFVILIL